MKKENISILAFAAVLIIALVRFLDSSVYTALFSDHENVIQEYIKKSIWWGVFFGGSIAAIIVLLTKSLKKTK
ncbi:hypothetical protein [Chryseobacterium taiwanense]|uniref:Uncharacterized protein n=1 Tax=Chryseobacterium taiwanense TaxID=363331 RepID=A0A0B4E5H1_9FLAO|nr:hypothetical protein [Chryseobacterium taiwanense]KIC61863.1 hypothetical protein RM51_15965 [Chryseobacterium taiwanense]